MKQIVMSVILVLLVTSMGMAQDNAAVEQTAAEQPAAAAAQTSPLEELDWMVGQWVDQGEDSTITTTCSWALDRKFLKRSFSVEIEG